jgi:uncharacterized membrane protein YphA (DoxX/SURF4 family)
MEILFVLGRVLFGGYFLITGFKHFKHLGMMSGYAGSKGVPLPKVAVAVTGLLILFGGAGILIGVYVQWALYAIILFLLGVTFKMHDYWNITDLTQQMPQKINFDKNIALLGACLIMLSLPMPWVNVCAAFFCGF